MSIGDDKNWEEKAEKAFQYVRMKACGPSRDKCICACPESCGHSWDGPFIEFSNGGSSSCSKCGMLAVDHDVWVLP